MPKEIGLIQAKILLLLLGGAALSLTYSPRKYFKIIKLVGREWRAINREALRRSIRRLYESRLIDISEKPDGTITLMLTEHGIGKAKALTYNLDEIKIKVPEKWDKKWHMVVFDIPTHLKRVRETLRFHLRRLGFYPLQKSVFVYPFECRNEIDFLTEFFDVRRYVRYVTADHIDNEFHLKIIFKRALRSVTNN